MNATEIDNNNKKSKLFMENKDSDTLRSYPNDPKYALPHLQYTAFDIFQSFFFFVFFLFCLALYTKEVNLQIFVMIHCKTFCNNYLGTKYFSRCISFKKFPNFNFSYNKKDRKLCQNL